MSILVHNIVVKVADMRKTGINSKVTTKYKYRTKKHNIPRGFTMTKGFILSRK